MRIVAISDTHERHEELVLPEGDVLICAGDVTANGHLRSLDRFAGWMGRQPHRHKVLIAGNHDFCFEEKPMPSESRRIARQRRSAGESESPLESVSQRSSPQARIALFRSLFRGREDVYARRFESRKSGKSGYAPACGNEWVRGT